MSRLGLVGLAAALALVGCGGPAPRASGASGAEQVRAAEAARAVAIRDHDTAALSALVDPAAAGLAAAQVAAMGALATAPVTDFAVRTTGVTGSGDALTAAVVTAYQVTGFDTAPQTVASTDSWRRVGGRWLLAAVAGPATIWDDGPLVAVHGVRSLVLASAGQAATARQVADAVDAAVPAVTAVWGAGWPQRAVVQLPATAAQFTALTGQDGATVAAVESTELHAAGTRITVSPVAWARLSPAGRGVIVRHELTHVASAAATTASVPTWLVEGLADAVGYAGSGLDPARITAELAADVRAGRAPSALPADAAFTGPDAPAAYEEGWLAATLVESRAGAAGLVALYRRVGASGLPAAQALDAGLRATLGLSTAQFEQLWRQRVEALA